MRQIQPNPAPLSLEGPLRLGSPVQAEPESHPFRVSFMVGEDQFTSLRPIWESLVAQEESVSPYQSWAWIASWLSVFGPENQIVCSICQDSHGTIEAIVPFFLSRQQGLFQPRILRMLGFHPIGGPNGLTEVPIKAMSRGVNDRPELWQAVDDALRAELERGTWDAVTYRRTVCAATPEPEKVNRGDKTIITIKRMRGCEVVNLPDTWDKYRKQLSKSMRENLPYYPKKLVKDGHQWEVVIHPGAEAATALEQLVHLHKLRTYSDQSLYHNEYFEHPSQLQMLHSGISSMQAVQGGFVASLLVDGKVIASQAFIRNDRTLVALYSGFDPAWGKYSPMLILQAEVFKQAISAGIARLDLLRGNAPWQARWGATEENPIENVTLVKSSAWSSAKVGSKWGAIQLASLIKGYRPLKRIRYRQEFKRLTRQN